MGAYFSGIIILFANCLYYPNTELAKPDHKLAKDGAKMLAHLIQVTQDDQVDQIMSILNDLEFIADRAIARYGNPEVIPQPPTVAESSYTISDDFFGATYPLVDSVSDVIHL